MPATTTPKQRSNGTMNQLDVADRPVHDWYRFVLSYPPHVVRQYLEKFGVNRRQRVLDPFCGTGTTVVECKKNGIKSVGIEAHPMSHLAASAKADWASDPEGLWQHSREVAERVYEVLQNDGVPDSPLPLFGGEMGEPTAPLHTLPDDLTKLLLKNSISPRPMHKGLVLRDALREARHPTYHRHQTLALAKTLVNAASNLHFGPEVGVGRIRTDAAVVEPWLAMMRTICDDLAEVRDRAAVEAVVHHADARDMASVVPPRSVNAVITSPPYPNEKDYTRTTRLESVMLGLIDSKDQLRQFKKTLVRSNTRGIYKADDDDQWIGQFPRIQEIADRIEARRIELGKTSGFERMYPRVTKLYFGGMAKHFADLRRILRPGAQLGYVVGDQASYLQVMIRTGQLLAEIAETLGYEVVGLDLFRTRLATATGEQLREEVVVLRWPGTHRVDRASAEPRLCSQQAARADRSGAAGGAVRGACAAAAAG